MNRSLISGWLGALALAGIAFVGSAALAEPITFGYTGSLVDFTVPTTGEYQILAYGAQGGSITSGGITGVGGLGAEIGGDISLTAGEVLQIAVGGMGTNDGGGGGSFVVGPGNAPLVIAGGGGGGGIEGPAFTPSSGVPGGGGLTGPNGGGADASLPPPNGINGSGGANGDLVDQGGGGGGGGFLSAGANDPFTPALFTGGGAFPSLTGGEAGGGFGGGGGGSSGGGGGYSGGAGGGRHEAAGDFPFPGGGGGSFDAGTNQILMADFNAGNGEVVITPIPEPATLALFGAGLLSFAVIRRPRIRKKPGGAWALRD